MKKITSLTVFMLTISFGFLNAQTEQGKVLLGASSTLSLTGSNLMSLGYSSEKYKSDASGSDESDPIKTISMNLSPKVGYFVIDNLALGLDVNIASSTTKFGNRGDKYSQNMLSVGPFVRYYIPTSKVLPFAEINGSFGSIKNIDNYSNIYGIETEYKSSVMSIGGGIGLAAPLGDKVTFDILAGYNSVVVKRKEDNDDNYRTVTGTLGLKIGLTILL